MYISVYITHTHTRIYISRDYDNTFNHNCIIYMAKEQDDIVKYPKDKMISYYFFFFFFTAFFSSLLL